MYSGTKEKWWIHPISGQETMLWWIPMPEMQTKVDVRQFVGKRWSRLYQMSCSSLSTQTGELTKLHSQIIKCTNWIPCLFVVFCRWCLCERSVHWRNQTDSMHWINRRYINWFILVRVVKILMHPSSIEKGMDSNQSKWHVARTHNGTVVGHVHATGRYIRCQSGIDRLQFHWKRQWGNMRWYFGIAFATKIGTVKRVLSVKTTKVS